MIAETLPRYDPMLRFEAALRRFDAANSLDPNFEIVEGVARPRELVYAEQTVAKVQTLNLKKNFPHDPDSRVLEDALCLVFLEFQFAELAAKTTDDKLINALQKSWKKMTAAAREHAVKLNFGPKEKSLLERALAGRET